MAHVREVDRKAGRAYEVRWRDGTRERQRTFTVKRDAERFALKVENAKAAGESTAAQTRSVPTVAQVAERVQAAAALTLKPRTVHSAGLLYSGRVLPRFGTRKVTTITRADVEDWVAELIGEGLAPSTVHHCYVALRKVMKHAHHDRLLTYNPCDGVRLPRVQPDEDAVRFLTVAEVDRLAAVLAHEPVYALLVRFAAFTGLRAAEVAGLRVGDVDLARGHVSVRQTLQRIGGEWVVGTPKSRRSTRDVPLVHSGLTADLRRYVMAHPNSGNPAALFWPGRTHGSAVIDYERVMDVGSVRRNYLSPAVARAGLGSMRFHDLRHTAASLWLAAGFKPYEVSRWLGHASLATTDAVYSHLYPTDYAEHVARFDAFAQVG